MSRAKTSTLQDFVYTTSFVKDNVPVREVKTWFATQPNVRALGVVREGEVETYGLITRSILNTFLLEQSGNSSALDEPVSSIMINEPVTSHATTPVTSFLESFLATHGESDTFYDDIVLYADKAFAGLVAVRDILTDQLSNYMHRVTALEAQQAALTRQNKELFENSFRQGQRETQFRSFFEQSPVPIAIFDKNGDFVAASRRFFNLSAYTPKQVDHTFHFEKLFANKFKDIAKDTPDDWTDLGPTENALRPLTLLAFKKPPVEVSAVVEIMPDWGHFMVSLLGLVEGQAEGKLPTIINASEGTPGKITQAIRTKIRSQAQGLAKSVAANLIDREQDIDRLMSKLESIFEVTARMESIAQQQPDPAPPTTDEEPDQQDTRQHMKGTLDEFSPIDLCQILIQGTKTGQLLLHRDQEEELCAYIYFYCGSIVHAKHRDGFVGQDALAPILKMKQGRFDFIFNKAAPKTTVQGDPMGLLMDACREADESSAAS